MDDEFNNELMELFIEETRENLQMMEEGLLKLEQNKYDQEAIHIIFRCMHTIKGGAGLVGLKAVNQFAHKLENVLEGIRQSQIELDADLFHLLFTSTDILKNAIDAQEFSEEPIHKALEEMEAVFEQYGDFQKIDLFSPTHTSHTHCYRITLRFQPSIFESGTDPIMLLNELDRMGRIHESHCDVSRLPLIEDLDPHVLYLEWTILLETDKSRDEVEQVFIFVIDDNEIIVEDMSAKDAETDNLQKNKTMLVDTVSSTIRVDTEKLESILNYLAELLISQSRVKELVLSRMNDMIPGEKHAWKREIIAGFEDVDKIIRTIQENVMDASMVSIGGTFRRYQRMIRDLAKAMGKEVRVEIEGKETELDKRVIEQIADPLKHLIRNAMDHGLEFPDERERAGKPRTGLISLKAFHQEGRIVIQISDDGKGIDEQEIYEKALANQLIDKDHQLGKQELLMLLFQPGFSTAKTVTDISGRGVGLDVVLNNIKQLRGSIEIDSELGKGTVITIILPLTLAIVDGMLIRLGKERFIIPMNMISEFYKVNEEDIHRAEGRGIFVHLRGENIPYAALYTLLNIQGDCRTPEEGIMVILQYNNRKLALMVDEIVGQEQAVIKNFRENMPEAIEGVAGVTILGNGKVAIILDIPTIYTMVRKRGILEYSASGR